MQKPSTTQKSLKYTDTGKKRKIIQYTGNNKEKEKFFYRGREKDRKNSMQVLPGSA